MGSSGILRESGLRGIAWLPVDANGARLPGGTLPGGQRVEALGGMAVALFGTLVGGLVGFGAANATTDAAPNSNPESFV
jgi:hypothetical protein